MNNNYNNGMPNQNVNYGGNMPNQGMNYGGVPTGPSFASKIPLDKTSIIGYVGSILTAVSTFLPFTVVSALGISQSVSYFSNNGELADGAFVCALMIATLILIVFRKNLIGMVTTAVAALIFINNLIKIGDVKSSYGSFVDVKTGAAVYLIIVGLIILVVHFVMYIKENPNCFQTLFKRQQQPMMYANQNMNYNQPQPMPNQNMNYNQPQPMPNQDVNNQQNQNNNNQV